MFKNILNLQGVTVLSSIEKQSINGGSQSCTFTFTYGSGHTETFSSGGFSDGQAGSTEANAACVDVIVTAGNGVVGCRYDCDWDNAPSIAQ